MNPAQGILEQSSYSLEQSCTLTGLGRNQLRMWLTLWREIGGRETGGRESGSGTQAVGSDTLSARTLYFIAQAHAQARANPIDLGPEQALRNVVADLDAQSLTEEQAAKRISQLPPAAPRRKTSAPEAARVPNTRNRSEFERLRLSLVTPNPSPETLRATVLWLEQQDTELGKARHALALSQLELTHARNQSKALERKLIPWWRKLPKFF